MPGDNNVIFLINISFLHDNLYDALPKFEKWELILS